MDYIRFGDSGLRVSRLCLGTWHLPVKNENFKYNVDRDLSIKIIKRAYDLGINFFDTANVYNGSIYPENAGLSEDILGDALSGYERESLVISTKFMGKMGSFQNASGLSKKYLLWQIHESLKRLKTDYIDILHMHRPDPETPIEETVSAFKIINDDSMALYFGESYFHFNDIEDIARMFKSLNMKLLSMQEPYNLIERDIESEKFDISRNYGMGIMAYIPIAQGILTDKYLKEGGENSRASFVPELRQRYLSDKNNIKVLSELNEYAVGKGVKLAQLALAWMIKKSEMKNISLVPIIGATKIEQLEDDVSALDIKLTEDEVIEIENIASGFVINWNSPYTRIRHSIF
ncbi:aldo/keto reductase [Picrophilus oshimae]|nr:aldo/keto reductase [Picrophilus oshimae]